METIITPDQLNKIKYLAECLGLKGDELVAEGESVTIPASGTDVSKIKSDLFRMTDVISSMGGRLVVRYAGIKVIIDLR